MHVKFTGNISINQQDAQEYEDWKHWGFPCLHETLEEFPSVAIDAALLVSQLPLLQPRFYSISSSPLIDPHQIDITAAVIAFKTQGRYLAGYLSHFTNDLHANNLIFSHNQSNYVNIT